MHLDKAFDLTVRVSTPPVDLGRAPDGQRVIVPVLGGTASGRLTGEILAGGGDWLLITGAVASPDVRLTVRTHDGANIAFRGTGRFVLNEAAQSAMRGERSTEFEDHYLRINWTLETGDPRYSWVNDSVFTCQGRMRPGGVVDYEFYRIA